MSTRDAESVRGALTSLTQAVDLVHPVRVANALGLPMRYPKAALMTFALGWLVLFFVLQVALGGTLALVLSFGVVLGAMSGLCWLLGNVETLESPAQERLAAELLEAERFLGELGERAPRAYLGLERPLVGCTPRDLARVLPHVIRELEQR